VLYLSQRGKGIGPHWKGKEKTIIAEVLWESRRLAPNTGLQWSKAVTRWHSILCVAGVS
jgi:hypothetical protein